MDTDMRDLLNTYVTYECIATPLYRLLKDAKERYTINDPAEKLHYCSIVLADKEPILSEAITRLRSYRNALVHGRSYIT